MRFLVRLLALAATANAQLGDLLKAGACSVRLAAGETILGGVATSGSCWLEGVRRRSITTEAVCVVTGVCSEANTATDVECVGLGSCSDARGATDAECRHSTNTRPARAIVAGTPTCSFRCVSPSPGGAYR